MVNVLFREGWLKPLLTESLPVDICKLCNKEFQEMDFITTCEFCEIGLVHEICNNKHVISKHNKELKEKIDKHKEKRLHSFQ